MNRRKKQHKIPVADVDIPTALYSVAIPKLLTRMGLVHNPLFFRMDVYHQLHEVRPTPMGWPRGIAATAVGTRGTGVLGVEVEGDGLR